MEPYWDAIKRIIDESDVVLHVLDARLVELSRNEQVEELVKEAGRPLIFVINKSDLITKKSLKKQIKQLKVKGEVVFVSNKNKKSARILLYTIKRMFRKYGKRKKNFSEEKPKFREAIGDIVAGVLGYPNVGKSSIINALSHKGKGKVSKKAGTTHGVQWIRATKEIKLIDSPGVIPLKKDDEIRYGLIGARDVDKIKDKEAVASALIKLFLNENKDSFERFYEIKINDSEVNEIIKQLGERKRFFLKGEKLDENRVHVMIIRDWQNGKLLL